MTVRLSPEERADDSLKSWRLAVQALREINIRRGNILPTCGDVQEQAWAAEGEVPPSRLHCTLERESARAQATEGVR